MVGKIAVGFFVLLLECWSGGEFAWSKSCGEFTGTDSEKGLERGSSGGVSTPDGFSVWPEETCAQEKSRGGMPSAPLGGKADGVDRGDREGCNEPAAGIRR